MGRHYSEGMSTRGGGSPGWIRTTIRRFRACCPAVRRPGRSARIGYRTPRRFSTGPAGPACRADVGQAVVVALGRVVGEVLHELPVVALGVVEVDAPTVGMPVRDGRVLVAGGAHPLAQR